MANNIDTLLQMKANWTSSDFVFFWGHTDRGEGLSKACLSQWFQCPFIVDNQYYNCAEQYMMAEKARIFGDEEIRQQIFAEYNQMAMKKLGRKVRNYNDITWKEKGFDVVVKGNIAKFSQNEKLLNYLYLLVKRFWWKPVLKIPFGVLVLMSYHLKQYNLINGKEKTF